MREWFDIKQIDDDTYVISEYGHTEETHCYLLQGSERSVLIDTGIGISDIRKITDRICTLPVTVLTTHAHWDHIGSHASFEDIYVHADDIGWLRGHFPLPLEAVRNMIVTGLTAEPEGFDRNAYHIPVIPYAQTMRDGDVFDLGNRKVRVIHTPGHSPGHCCFYEEDRGYLYTGDLVYKGRLDANYPSTDPVQFCASVKKVSELNVTKVFPGHHDLDVPASLIRKIRDAFASLEDRGLLYQGSGLYDYGCFQINI
ncbi:MAG: MBL fold metallo-hydrolase [Solobacterium sp.]|nr:MBL fold metallo-hydrolase [Solobacterium sp.]